jgi:TatD DNase family protein
MSFADDREAVLARAADAGVRRIVEVADAAEDWPRVLALARARPALIKAALGIHPYYADKLSEQQLARLERMAALPEVVAIGEIGLDYARGPVPRETQVDCLRRILLASREWKLPLIIHCRQAYTDLRMLFKELFPDPPKARRGVVHCFSGTPEDAEACIAAGFFLGADGPVTYPKNDSLREAFRRAGPSAVLVETDSPYLPPQSCRGRRNEPANLPEITAALAKIWNLSLDETAAVTMRSGLELFDRASRPGF